MIRLVLDSGEKLFTLGTLQNIDCWDEFTKNVELFLEHGYDTNSEIANPTGISVDTDFSVHDGGEAILRVEYSAGKKDVMNLWSQWYSPLDMTPKWGAEQDILAGYLRKIMLLEVYH